MFPTTISIFKLLAKLPLPLRQWIGFVIGWLYAWIPSRDGRFTRLQLINFLFRDPVFTARNKSPPSTKFLCAKVFGNAGKVAFESLNLDPLLQDLEKFSIPNRANLEEILQSNVPVLALTGHFGNWDLLGAYIAKLGYPLTVIGRRARHPKVQFILEWIRARHGLKVIWRADRNGLREINEILNSSGILGVLLDQDTALKSIPVPFFGRLARTPVTVVDLALRRKVHIISAFLLPLKNGRFEVNYQILRLGDEESLSNYEVLTRYSSHLADVIRQYPESWVWFHKRWRSNLSGERISSAAYLKELQS
jgi:KDO2-lipid IV(A) lauroyltransferase